MISFPSLIKRRFYGEKSNEINEGGSFFVPKGMLLNLLSDFKNGKSERREEVVKKKSIENGAKEMMSLTVCATSQLN